MDTLQFLKVEVEDFLSNLLYFYNIFIHFNGNHHSYIKLLFIIIERGTIIKKILLKHIQEILRLYICTIS